MERSILKSIKTVLGYDLDDAFDNDIMMHINTVFATLTDLGVGPEAGFMIMDDTATWDQFYGSVDLTLNRIQTYVYLRVRQYFDPPGTPHHITAMNEQIQELTYYIQTHREVTKWSTPTASSSLPFPM